MSGVYLQYPQSGGGGSASTGSQTGVAYVVGPLDGAAANNQGGTIGSFTFYQQSATASFPGLVSSQSQTWAGKKTFNAGLDAGSNKITSVTDPTLAQDAATKNYVDTQLAAFQPLEAVVAASTGDYPGLLVGNILTITATGAISVDGVTPSASARILLKNQTSQEQNGVYVVTTVGSVGVAPVLTRAADYNTAAAVNSGASIPVLTGATNALTSWIQTATVAALNTDPLVFQQFTANPQNYPTLVGVLNAAALSVNGAVIGSSSLFLQGATATVPGLVSSAAQTFAGVKTFSSAPVLSALSASAVLQLDSSKNVIVGSVDLSSQVTGSVPASRVSGVLPIANGGTGTSSFITGSIPFYAASGTFAEANPGLFWDTANSALLLGSQTGIGIINVVNINSGRVGLEVRSNVSAAISAKTNGANVPLQLLQTANSPTNPCQATFSFSRGTLAVPTAVSANDLIGRLLFNGYGSSYYTTGNASIDAVQTQTGFTGNQGGRLIFNTTKNSTSVLVEAFRIDQDQQSYHSAKTYAPAMVIGSVTLTGSTGASATAFSLPGDLGGISGSQLNMPLTLGSGGFTSWTRNGQFNHASVSSTYAMVANDSFLTLTSQSMTVTLQALAGQPGKMVTAKHNGANFTQSYNISPSGGETIEGLAQYRLYTTGESVSFYSDGTSSVKVLQHNTATQWAGWTPTDTQGIGSITNNALVWRRDGCDMLIRGRMTSGTVTGVEARLSLPGGTISSSTGAVGSTSIAGVMNINGATAGVAFILVQANNAYLNFGQQTSGATGLTVAVGNAAFANTISYSFEARVPIEGWLP